MDSARSSLEHQIAATDRQIDRLVYELYGLTEEEIRIVEEGTGGMRVYLDVSCLNRPFDDQSQRRVRLEAEAVVRILERCISGDWQHVSSSNAIDEIDAMPNPDRQARVRKLLPAHSDIMKLTAGEYDRAASLVEFGIKPANALHVAAAESLKVDVLLSCDDRLCRTARRNRDKLLVRVFNPIEWIKEAGDAPDVG